MEPPVEDITVKSLAGQKITSVKLLGSDEKVEWSQNSEAVVIKLPKKLPNIQPAVFAVQL
jgi:alpha-L-fucosidase